MLLWCVVFLALSLFYGMLFDPYTKSIRCKDIDVIPSYEHYITQESPLFTPYHTARGAGLIVLESIFAELYLLIVTPVVFSSKLVEGKYKDLPLFPSFVDFCK